MAGGLTPPYRRCMADEEPTAEPTSDAEVRDALPEDLNVSEFVGPYVFPNNNRRRVPGYLYLMIGVACIAAWVINACSSELPDRMASGRSAGTPRSSSAWVRLSTRVLASP